MASSGISIAGRQRSEFVGFKISDGGKAPSDHKRVLKSLSSNGIGKSHVLDGFEKSSRSRLANPEE